MSNSLNCTRSLQMFALDLNAALPCSSPWPCAHAADDDILLVRTLRDKLQARDSRFLDNYASGFFVGAYNVRQACSCAVCHHFPLNPATLAVFSSCRRQGPAEPALLHL